MKRREATATDAALVLIAIVIIAQMAGGRFRDACLEDELSSPGQANRVGSFTTTWLHPCGEALTTFKIWRDRHDLKPKENHPGLGC